MNTTTLRWIDYWIGRPLCALLTWWRWICSWFFPERASGLPRSILIVKLEEQGAMVLAGAALAKAHSFVGKEHVYFCTFDQNDCILRALGLLEEKNVFTLRSDSFVHLLFDTVRVLWRIRRLRIDAVIDMEFFARGSAAFSFLTGARIRVGLHHFTSEIPYRGDLMTHRVAYNPYLHTARAYELLVDALKEEPGDIPLLKVPAHREASFEPPCFTPGKEDFDAVYSVLGVLRERVNAPVIVFHPNLIDTLRVRKWDIRRYRQLGRWLLEAYPRAVLVITGLGDEVQGAEELRRSLDSDRVYNAAGALSLRELLTLFTCADVLVTNDSGPAHFASATPIHVVALFGPETPLLFRPLGARVRVIYHALACSPCLTTFKFRLSPCRNNVCMQAITAEEVFEAVRVCLAERGFAAEAAVCAPAVSQ
jgi:ADP-heptose:LPS heptosyltransferase